MAARINVVLVSRKGVTSNETVIMTNEILKCLNATSAKDRWSKELGAYVFTIESYNKAIQEKPLF